MKFTILISFIGLVLVTVNGYAIGKIPDELERFYDLKPAYKRIAIGWVLLLWAAYRAWG